MVFGDVAADGSIRMNSKVYRTIVSAHIQPNAGSQTGRHFTERLDNDPKHTA